MKDDGGPAFQQSGMSLRDWFAGQALSGLLAKQGRIPPSHVTPLALQHYAIAAYCTPTR